MTLATIVAEELLLGVGREQVGMVYFTTNDYDHPNARMVPTPASCLRNNLNLPSSGTLSTIGGCCSFMANLGEAARFVEATGRKALVVGMEDSLHMRVGTPSYIYGSACAGLLLSPTPEKEYGLLAYENTVTFDTAEKFRNPRPNGASLELGKARIWR